MTLAINTTIAQQTEPRDGRSGVTEATRPNQVLAIVCAGIVLANLDLFIVNVALPNIAQEFDDPDLGFAILCVIPSGIAIVGSPGSAAEHVAAFRLAWWVMAVITALGLLPLFALRR